MASHCYDAGYCTCACGECKEAVLKGLSDSWHCAVHGRGCHKGCSYGEAA